MKRKLMKVAMPTLLQIYTHAYTQWYQRKSCKIH